MGIKNSIVVLFILKFWKKFFVREKGCVNISNAIIVLFPGVEPRIN